MRKTLWSPGYRTVVELLGEVMEEAGLERKELAKRLGKPRSYVSKVLRGERKMDPEECSRWAEACELKSLQFWTRYGKARDRKLRRGV